MAAVLEVRAAGGRSARSRLHGHAAFVFDLAVAFYGNSANRIVTRQRAATRSSSPLPDVPVGEQALLVALHPSYPTKPYLYAYYTRTVDGQPENQIVQLTDSMGTGEGFNTLFALPAADAGPRRA